VRLATFLTFLCLSLPARAATEVTVGELEQFLLSRQASEQSDFALADRLGRVVLSEQLTESRLAGIESRIRLGPQACEQLQILAAASILRPPPGAQIPLRPNPDQATQRQIIAASSAYVTAALAHLPDFLATRVTVSFDDLPRNPGKKRPQFRTMHFVRQARREIAYRNGAESDAWTVRDARTESFDQAGPTGLTTWGEFGPVLALVLGDWLQGSLAWSRWQSSESGVEVAVFRYRVPRTASHYLIDFCCYQPSEDLPPRSFRGEPGYHGEISIHPQTGAIDRITVEPEFAQADPVRSSAMAVQYGHVLIGGIDAICPTRSVALSEIRVFDAQASEGFTTTRFVNEARYVDYHKFGSTMRVVPDP
jgi:hypothetical protein